MNMPDQVFKDQLLQLERACEADDLPDATMGLARDCIARAKRNLRVAIVGGDAPATTDVVNFFLGTDLLPVDMGHDVPARIAFGTPGQVEYKTEENLLERRPVGELEDVLADDPLSVAVTTPLDPLTRFTLMRIGMETDEFATGTSKILAGSDVVFWCSDTFNDLELAYWSEVPHRVADHSYLVVSKGAAQNDAHRRLFHKVLEVDIQAAESLRTADVLDAAAFEESGGAALLGAMRHEISTAKRALEDTVNVLFARIGAPDGGLPTTKASGTEAPGSAIVAEHLNSPWKETDFDVSRVRGTVKPRRIKRVAPATRSSRPEFVASSDDGEDATPTSTSDAGSPSEPVQNLAETETPDRPNEIKPLAETETTTLAGFLSSGLSEARKQKNRRQSKSGDTSQDDVNEMVGSILEDAQHMLAGGEEQSDTVLDWVEDRLTSARILFKSHGLTAAGQDGALTDPIDDALEAVGILRFEEDGESAREDALRMTLDVGRELQSRLAV